MKSAVILSGIVLSAVCSAASRGALAQTVAQEDRARDGRDGALLLARKISVQLDRVSLDRAIQAVAGRAGTTVQYQSSVVDRYDHPVTVHATNEPLRSIFERLFTGTTLDVVAVSKTQLVVIDTRTDTDSLAPHTTGTLVGRITDSTTGAPIARAAVTIDGMKLSTLTGDNGRFTLRDVPLGEQKLSVRLFGYRPVHRIVTVTVEAPAPLRIVLVPAPNMLVGVVTTAVGTQDRRKIGQDITVLNADSIMRIAPIKTVTDLLETRVPGLTVTRTSGVPGAPSRIRIRGVSGGLVPGATNQSNDPIVMVDGIRVYAQSSTQRDQNNAAPGATAASAIDQIDPNSIETIEVFKGPSASAQFGADAANGVIVITTKRGRAGAVQLSSTLNYGQSRLPGVYAQPGYYVFGHDETQGELGGLSCGIDPSGSGTPNDFRCITDTVLQFQALDIPRLNVFSTGIDRSASVTATGGTSAVVYALTGTATDNLGMYKMPALYQDQYRAAYHTTVPSWMKRPTAYKMWSGTGKISSDLTPYLNVQFTSSLTTSDGRQGSALGQLSQLANNYVDTTVFDALLIGRYAQRITSREQTINNTLFGSWKRWARLPLQVTLGLSTADRLNESYVPYGVLSSASQQSNLYAYADSIRGANGTTYTRRLGSSTGYYSASRPTSQSKTARVAGTLAPSGRVVTEFGIDFNHMETRDLGGEATTLGRGVTVPSKLSSAVQASTTTNTGGWFVAPRFNFNERFFVAPGFRIDSRSGVQRNTSGFSQLLTRPQVLFTNPRSLFRGGLSSILPKMDFSWVAIDRQGQAPLWGALSFLRPRLAFGTTGVQPDPSWLLRTYQPALLADSTGGAFAPGVLDPYPGVRLATIGNPVLRPERKRELEYGGEMQLWGNRLTVNTSGWYQLRYDAIEPIPLAPSAGGLSLLQYRNIGTTRGTGVEVTFEAIPVQTAALSWSVRGALSTNHEILLRRDGALPVIEMGNGVRLVPGYPLNGRWDRPIMGYSSPDSGRFVSAHDIVVGDSVQYLGSATPGYTLPLSSQLTLLNGALTVDVGFNYQHGLTQFGSSGAQGLINLYFAPTSTVGQQAAALAAFCALRAPVTTAGAITNNPCSNAGTLAGVVQTVNVLRWNSLSVGYTLPRQLTRRVRIPRMRVAVQGSNLGLWSKYRGKDPDVNGTPVGEALEDNGQIPTPRTLGIQFNLGN